MEDSKKILTVQELSSKAGRARAEKLSPQRRSEIAKIANNAKNSKGLPKATHGGILKIHDREIECAVLPDKKRVISLLSISNMLGFSKPNADVRKKSMEAKVPFFMSSDALKPYYDRVFLMEADIIEYSNKLGIKTQGISAEMLPKICDVFLLARRENELPNHLIPVAITCEIILMSLAKVGIIALIDESTGFQEDRARDELQTLLQTFISNDLLPWTQRFPHQFFREVYRIHGWKYAEKQCQGPRCLGTFINKYVYDALSPDVKLELQKKNPIIPSKGVREHKHHQFLSRDYGVLALERHLTQCIGLLRASRSKEEFEELFDRVFSGVSQMDWINQFIK